MFINSLILFFKRAINEKFKLFEFKSFLVTVKNHRGMFRKSIVNFHICIWNLATGNPRNTNTSGFGMALGGNERPILVAFRSTGA